MFDLICFVPPFANNDSFQISPELSPIICLVAVAIIFLLFFVRLFKQQLGFGKVIGWIIASCIVVLSFGFIKETDLNFVFIVFYIPMMLIIRFIEGILISSKLKKIKNIKIYLPVVIIFVAIFLAMAQIPKEITIIIQLLWSVTGVLIASFQITKMVTKTNKTILFDNVIAKIGLYVIFGSTLFYISTDATDKIIYMIVLPIGFAIRFIGSKKFLNPALYD